MLTALSIKCQIYRDVYHRSELKSFWISWTVSILPLTSNCAAAQSRSKNFSIMSFLLSVGSHLYLICIEENSPLWFLLFTKASVTSMTKRRRPGRVNLHWWCALLGNTSLKAHLDTGEQTSTEQADFSFYIANWKHDHLPVWSWVLAQQMSC